MVDYFEAIHRGNSDQIINLLVDRFPDFAIGVIKYWEKEGQVKRFYINAKDGSEDKSFNLNITPNTIYVNDYDELFWNPILDVSSMMEFKKELMKLVDEVLHGTY